MKYKDLLISPPPSREEIHKAIKYDDWQELRISLKGVSTEAKLRALRAFLKKENNSRVARVVVHNYVNALKRGGLLR